MTHFYRSLKCWFSNKLLKRKLKCSAGVNVIVKYGSLCIRYNRIYLYTVWGPLQEYTGSTALGDYRGRKKLMSGGHKARLKREWGRRWKPGWKLLVWLLTAGRLLSWFLRAVVGFSRSPISLSLSLGVDQIWHPYIFSISSSPCILPNLSFLSLISRLPYYCGHPSIHRPRHHAESKRLEKSSRSRGKRSQSWGPKVSLHQDRGGWGGKCRLCCSLSPPPQHTSQTNTWTTALL